VRYWSKTAAFNIPQLYIWRPHWGDPVGNSQSLTVLVQYWHVMDGRTDKQTQTRDDSMYNASIAPHSLLYTHLVNDLNKISV